MRLGKNKVINIHPLDLSELIVKYPDNKRWDFRLLKSVNSDAGLIRLGGKIYNQTIEVRPRTAWGKRESMKLFGNALGRFQKTA
jgi:hypothetical protein